VFTGIVERVAAVRSVRRKGGAMELSMELGDLVEGLVLGASVAINGACLTVTWIDGGVVTFDVVSETVGRTNLAGLEPGHLVNVERSLRAGGAIDGHLVQGHIDGMARVARIQDDGGQWTLVLDVPADLMRFMVVKGSVAVDGISLTLADVADGRISVAVIPTTLERTTLGRRRVGESVNIETDLIVRIVVRQLELQLSGSSGGGVTLKRLIENGFA